MNNQPLVFIRPTSQVDVAREISFLTQGGFPINIRNGGHDTYGRAFVERGVNFDMRSLDAITMSKDHNSAQIGGGVLSGNLAVFLETLNLFTPTGACHEVRYVGWA
jgi:FAD/FMN-containing dehydrogenase